MLKPLYPHYIKILPECRLNVQTRLVRLLLTRIAMEVMNARKCNEIDFTVFWVNRSVSRSGTSFTSSVSGRGW